MPRRRVLSPELWSDARVLRLGDFGKLVWVGIISQADDEGLVEIEPSALKAALCLRAPSSRVGEAIDEIAALGLVARYPVNGQVFTVIPTFFKWQNLDRPSPTRHVRPPEEVLARFPAYIQGRRVAFNGPRSRHKGLFGDGPEGACPGHVPDESWTSPAEVKGKEVKGIEGKGSEGKKNGPSDSSPAASVPHEQFISEWNSRIAVTHAAKILNLSPDRRRTLGARWKDRFWREHWLEALDRTARSRFLRGEAKPRDGQRRFKLDADFFLRPGKVEEILEGKHDDQPGTPESTDNGNGDRPAERKPDRTGQTW